MGYMTLIGREIIPDSGLNLILIVGPGELNCPPALACPPGEGCDRLYAVNRDESMSLVLVSSYNLSGPRSDC